MDLLAYAAGRIVDQDVYVVAFGSGEPEYEEFFLRAAAEHPGRIAVKIGFDNALAHRMEAGADCS